MFNNKMYKHKQTYTYIKPLKQQLIHSTLQTKVK